MCVRVCARTKNFSNHEKIQKIQKFCLILWSEFEKSTTFQTKKKKMKMNEISHT